MSTAVFVSLFIFASAFVLYVYLYSNLVGKNADILFVAVFIFSYSLYWMSAVPQTAL